MSNTENKHLKLIDVFQKEKFNMELGSFGGRHAFCCACEKDTFIFKFIFVLDQRFICQLCAEQYTIVQVEDIVKQKIETAKLKEGKSSLILEP